MNAVNDKRPQISNFHIKISIQGVQILNKNHSKTFTTSLKFTADIQTIGAFLQLELSAIMSKFYSLISPRNEHQIC